MPDDQHPMNDGPHLDPRLKEFIDRVIVPILVKEYLAQSQETEMRKLPMTEQLNFSFKRMAEAAAVLGIKEANES